MSSLQLCSLLCWLVASAAVHLQSAAVHKKSLTGGKSPQGEGDLEHRFANVDHFSNTAAADDDSEGEADDEEDDDHAEADQSKDDADYSEEDQAEASPTAPPAESKDNHSLVQLSKDDEPPAVALKRVVLLLQTLQEEIRVEGEKETKMLDAHMCWCQDERHGLQVSIGVANEKVPQLQSDLMEADSTIISLQSTMKKHAAEIEDSTKALQEGTAMRKSEKQQAEQAIDDMTTDAKNMGEAIKALEAGRPASFLQANTINGLRAFTEKADFQARVDDTDAGNHGGDALLAYLDGTRTQSLDEILGICNQLKENMEGETKDTQAREAKAQTNFEKLSKTKEAGMTASKELIAQASSQLSSLTTKRGRLQDDLDATRASLAEDQMFKEQLEESCSMVQTEYHKRQEYRFEELTGAKEAVEILSGSVFDGRMQQASGFQASFLQIGAASGTSQTKRMRHRRSRSRLHRARRGHRGQGAAAKAHGEKSAVAEQLIMSMRRSKGREEPKVNFKLIRGLIDKTLMVLDGAQRKDDKDFAYCTKEIKDAEKEQGDLGQKIQDLGAQETERKETLAGLKKQIKEFSESIKAQDQLAAKLKAQRREEHAEHVQAMASNHKAMELLEMARIRLASMYTAKAALVQAAGAQSSDATENQPDLKTSGQALGEKAPEDSDRGTRVLDLLAKVKGEIKSECDAASAEEAKAQAEYEKMVESAKETRATDAQHLVEREVSRSDQQVRLHACQRDLASFGEKTKLVGSFLKDLHTKCDQLLVNYKPHKAGRKSNAESLNNAHGLLKATGGSS